MYLKSIQIDNYKSFYKSEIITFTEGINVIIGKNGAGKTALLEALLPQSITPSHHKSPITVPERGVNYDAGSENKRRFILTYDNQDIRRIVTNDRFYVRINNNSDTPYIRGLPQEFANKFNKNENMYLSFTYNYNSSEGEPFTTFNLEIQPTSQNYNFLYDKKNNAVAYNLNISAQVDMTKLLFSEFRNSVYFFSAERQIRGTHPLDGNFRLASDASNLVRVIHHLYTRRYVDFMEYLEYVRQIFPEIQFLGVPDSSYGKTNSGDETTYSANISLELWHQPIEDKRSDLTIRLDETGKGYAQILAMLYVVITAERPQLIIIDEPQTYLHPGAIRKLFNIFKQFPHHQYIVTTHSPVIVNAADPNNVLLVKKVNYRSEVQSIDLTQRYEIESLLNEVGSSISDVFGAESILWVEGPTEEKCLPHIIHRLCKQKKFIGTAIVGVAQTSDFDNDETKIELVKKLYKKLSTGNALVPPAVGYVFDREERSEEKRSELLKMGIYLTKYRLFENYLLDLDAIANVLTNSPYLDESFSSVQVEQWIEDNLWIYTEEQKSGWNLKYFGEIDNSQLPPVDTSLQSEDLLIFLHGAKLFKDLFLSLTSSKLEYHKPTHGNALTRWLIDKDRPCLKVLANELDEYLNKNESLQ